MEKKTSFFFNCTSMWFDALNISTHTDQTLYRTRPFTEFWVVSIEHLRRVWHADRGRLLLRTPGPVPLGLAYVLLVETNPFPNLSLFYRTLLFEYPSVLSGFHITEDMVRITLTSTHFKNLFSRKEGDLPVGFPDRFNSSSYSYSSRKYILASSMVFKRTVIQHIHKAESIRYRS